MQGANAIRRHHRHHHHPHFVQLDKPNEDILKKDPKYEELQKKKVAIQDAIEEETAPKELTEEEEKEKLDKEITTLQKEGEKVAETKLKDAKKSLKALELEEKQSGTPQAQKKAELTKLAGQYEEDLGKAAGALKEEDAKNEEKKEKSEKIKDLEASLKEVVDKQEKEVVALDKVRAKIANIVDEPKPVEADPVSNPKPKADLTAFQANLKKIEQEEEKKESEIEARKAAVKAIPPNPVVAAAEAAQEAHEAEMKKKFAEEKAAEERTPGGRGADGLGATSRSLPGR
jgi:hypothetical protein